MWRFFNDPTFGGFLNDRGPLILSTFESRINSGKSMLKTLTNTGSITLSIEQLIWMHAFAAFPAFLAQCQHLYVHADDDYPSPTQSILAPLLDWLPGLCNKFGKTRLVEIVGPIPLERVHFWQTFNELKESIKYQ